MHWESEKKVVEGLPLAGQTWVLTGSLELMSRDVAKEMKVPLVDHFRVWTEQETKGVDVGAWTTDQCHPNPLGHQKLADTLLPILRAALSVAK